MSFRVAGQSGQNHKKADLSLKINFFQNFRSRFGFLAQFYPYPQLEIKKYAQGQELLIFGVFLKHLPTVPWYYKMELPQNVTLKLFKTVRNRVNSTRDFKWCINNYVWIKK
jgi:hypothetical protein